MDIGAQIFVLMKWWLIVENSFGIILVNKVVFVTQNIIFNYIYTVRLKLQYCNLFRMTMFKQRNTTL